MEVVRVSRLMENFLSNQWNIYGLQVVAYTLMLLILNSHLTIFQMCIIALCMYIISVCQRILGIRFGMVYYERYKYKIEDLLDQIRKGRKKK